MRILVLRQQLAVYKRRSRKPLLKKQGSTVLVLAVKDLEGLDIGIDSRETGDCGPMEKEEVAGVLVENLSAQAGRTCNSR